VVGRGESAMLTACMLGRTFGVLVFIDELAEQVKRPIFQSVP
jgi:Asp/Glu/hydantoin racemase